MTQLDRIEHLLNQALTEIQALKASRPEASMQSHVAAPLAPVRGFWAASPQGEQNQTPFPAPQCTSAGPVGRMVSP